MVNQATLTGEPLAVERSVGDDVFAGTVVEDGSILVRVRANTAQTKLRSIVSLVQTADSLKSEGQSHMEDLANKIVPWNFLLAGLVALTTRSLDPDLSGADGRLLVRTQTHGFRCRHDCHERCCQDGRHGQGREVL